MEQSPSWEDSRFSARQEIPPSFYGTRKFITAHKRLYWLQVYMNLLHNLQYKAYNHRFLPVILL